MRPCFALAVVAVVSCAPSETLDRAAPLTTVDGGADAHGDAAGNRPPWVVYLWFSDGTMPPITNVRSFCPLSMTPPRAYRCDFGRTVEDCQAQIRPYLDRWFADFNLIFTYERPPSRPYTTVVVTPTNDWCGTDKRWDGFAPSTCNALPNAGVLALSCRYGAATCAAIIAHEIGHSLGLLHSAGKADIMYRDSGTARTGFLDQDLALDPPGCGRTVQNSRQHLLRAVGPWPAGMVKAGPSSTPRPAPDAGAPPSARDAAAADATRDTTAPGDATTAPRPRLDAGERMIDDPPMPEDHATGCSAGGRFAGGSWLAIAVAVFAGALRSRRRS